MGKINKNHRFWSIPRYCRASSFANFRDGLGPESAFFLDSSSRGSFTHLTLSKCKDILTKILQNTPYTGVEDRSVRGPVVGRSWLR
jgi:hypothetical protein